MRSSLLARVKALEAKSDQVRLVLVPTGDGRYTHRFSGRIFTEREVEAFGDQVLIVQTHVVTKGEKPNGSQDQTADS